jgi:hypothetical protein
VDWTLDPCGILSAKEWTERTGCGCGLPTLVGQSYSYLPSRKHTYLLERAHPTRGCADREGDFSQNASIADDFQRSAPVSEHKRAGKNRLAWGL